MQGSGGEDQRHPDPISKSTMEDSTAMTIDFLRARLLSERSVSRTARQRADQLAKRVVELEEQLKVVTAQRKKAESAAVEVITILKNLGRGDISEAFDSDSDCEEDDLSESRESNNSIKDEENSATSKSRRDDAEDRLSSSEVEASSISGRSLSWKASKGKNLNSHEKKLISQARRRQSSLVHNGGSSPKHRLGKSCRQIKRKDLREAAEDVRDLYHDGASVGTGDIPNHFEGRPDISNGDSLDEKDRAFIDNLVLHHPDKQIVSAPRGGDCRSEEMDRALEQQAQLIGLYEEEENAQREWEEKYRENNKSSMDLCEPGNQLDASEERNEPKLPAELVLSVTPEREVKMRTAESLAKEEEFYSRTLTDDFVPANSTTPETISSDKSEVVKSGTFFESSPLSINQGNPQTKMKEKQKPEVDSLKEESHLFSAEIAEKSPPISGTYGLNVDWSGSQKQHTATRDPTPPSELKGVLDALQLAKLSLQQELHRMPSSKNQILALPAPGDAQVSVDPNDISIGCSSLFRLPTELPSKIDARAALPLRPSYSDYGLNLKRSDGSLDTGHSVIASGVHSASTFVDVARSKVLDGNSYLDSSIMRSELSYPYAALSMPTRMPSFSPYNFLETMSRPMPEGDRYRPYDEKIRPPSTHSRQ